MANTRGVLQPYDWHLLGHEVDPKAPRVPLRRCDMPIPYDLHGLHVLTHRTAGLSRKLQDLGDDIAQGKETLRSGIGLAMSLIYTTKVDFAALQRDWDRDYAGLIRPPHLKLTAVEPSGSKPGTPE